MKTDLELLQLAAKAAGVEWPQNLNSWAMQIDGARGWNPLESLGDALSLAIKLKIELKFGETWSFAFNGRAFTEKHNDNAEAAVCRLITRVAADAGDQMP